MEPKPIVKQSNPREMATAEAMGMRDSDIALFKRAQFYATATIVPKDYQGNNANCYIAVEMAHRLNLNPLFVMNGLYIVHGKPTWSAQAMIQLAKANSIKKLTYIMNKADPNNWKCIAVALGNDDVSVEGPEISVEMAKGFGWWNKNPIWQNATELMLKYRAASWLIRTEFPECTGGLQTQDEVRDEQGSDTVATVQPKTLESFINKKEPQKVIDLFVEDTQEEKQRMEVFLRVEKKIAEKKKEGTKDVVLVNIIGFELQDIEKQPIETLMRIMKDLG